MKTQKQIKERILKIQQLLDEAEMKGYSNKIVDYSSHRRFTTQVNTLSWVLDEQKKTLGGKQ